MQAVRSILARGDGGRSLGFKRPVQGRRLGVALFQPTVPHYRAAFLNQLAQRLDEPLMIYSELPDPQSGLLDGTHSLTVPVRNSHTYRIGPFWCVPATLPAVVSRRHSVVVLSWNARQLELTLALLIGRLVRTPVLLWGHGVGHSGSTTAKAVRRLHMKLASAVIVYSRAGAEAVRTLGPATPVFVAQNTTGHPPPGQGDELQQLNMRVGYVGRFYPRKHLDRLLASIAELRAQGLYLEVCLMGGGPLEGDLRTLADDLGITEFVEFVPPSPEWEVVKAQISRMDFVVFPEWAGLGVVDAFAAARGALVLDSHMDNPPEFDYVVDGYNGKRYRSRHRGGLSEALRGLYADLSQARDMSRNAAAFYRENLTMPAVVEPFVEALKLCRDVR